MEILNKEVKAKQTDEEKIFTDSEIVLKNRKSLTISGVEKVYEANETKIQMRVAGCDLLVVGETLSVDKLSVEDGTIEISGTVNDLKFVSGKNSFLKRIFK
jgi:sporulation protein YabP